MYYVLCNQVFSNLSRDVIHQHQDASPLLSPLVCGHYVKYYSYAVVTAFIIKRFDYLLITKKKNIERLWRRKKLPNERKMAHI